MKQQFEVKNKYFVLVVIVFFCSCSSQGDSSNKTIQESLNGYGKKALLFIKYGGATVNTSLQVSLVGDGDKIKEDAVGNIFIADDSTGAIGEDDVKIFWKHPDSLEIFYKKILRVFKTEQQLMGVTILYKQVE